MKKLLNIIVAFFISDKKVENDPDPSPFSNSFPLSVDYTRSEQEMVDAGNYDYVSPDIQEVFLGANLPKTIVRFKARLFKFDFIPYSSWITQRMKEEGFRAANKAEILALGELYPDFQKEGSIVALRASFHDDDYLDDAFYVILLSYKDNKRTLNVCDYEYLKESMWFLGVQDEE